LIYVDDMDRRFKDSGEITYKNETAIDSNKTYTFSLDERFKPYDFCLIVNLDENNDIEAEINQHNYTIIPAGTSRTFNQLINFIKVKNIGNSQIPAGNIRLSVRNTGYQGKKLNNLAWDIIKTSFWILR